MNTNRIVLQGKTMLILIAFSLLPFHTYAQREIVEEEADKAIHLPFKKEPTGDIETLIKTLRFDEAEERLKKNITLAKRKRKDTTAMEQQLEMCTRGQQMLRGTDRVTIIDSVVVDKKNFLEGYKCSADLGTLRMSKDGRSTEFQTERGNRIYKAESADGKFQLVSYDIEDNKQTNRKVISGLDVDGDLNYPFLMTDGQTLYFAARSEEGLGNYDLFVTRYDYEDDRFYRAENLGFPYNSYANDYLMVIDEENKIGWFASDRYQPNGKVCIYTFIPNTSRHPYDYENDDQQKVINAASLRSFKSTWSKENEQARIQAKQALAFIKAQANQSKPYEFTIVINDAYTYHYYKDFRSAEAMKQCRDWMQKSASLAKLNQQLDAMREQYSSANDAKKKNMRQQILNLEKQAEHLAAEVHEAEKLTRNLELQ